MAKKKSNRFRLLAGAGLDALSGIHEKQASEAEKLRILKDRYRQEQEARRRK